MFERLGSLAYRSRFLVVAAWIALGAAAVLFAPPLAGQGLTDQSAFLPATTESVQARSAIERAFPGGTSKSSATIAVSRPSGLSEADRAYLDAFAAWLRGPEAPAALRDTVTGVDTATSRPELESMLRSGDGQLELMLVNLNVSMAGSGAESVVHALRAHIADVAATAPGLEVHVTGQAGISTDYLAAIKKGTESTTLVTIILVVAILLLIYRAPLAALVPLITIVAAFVVSRGTLGVLAALGWKVSSLLDTFLVVLVFGVGTDYAIFLISRFREELAQGDWHLASIATVRRIGEVITASAATVIVGLSAMAFGEFGMIQSTGPALAVAIFVTLVAGLTLTPALLGIFGHYLFWPLHEKKHADGDPDGFFARLAGAVSRRPGLVTAALLLALLVPAAALPAMRTNFNALAELPATADAKLGYDRVAEHLGKGTIVQSTAILDGGPDADLLTPASLGRLRDLVGQVKAAGGVDKVASLVTPEGDGVTPDGFVPSKQLAAIADDLAGDGATPGGAASGDTNALLDSKVTDGLRTALDYVNGLAAAFPDAAPGTAFAHARRDLATAQDQVAQVRDGIVVATQLHRLADSVLLPAAAGAGADAGGSFDILDGYLDELVGAFPELAGDANVAAARTALVSLRREASAGAALDLVDALDALAARFDARPEATLVSTSLQKTDEAKTFRREITATFDRLPADFRSLAAVFVGRTDDIWIPTNLAGEDGRKVQDALDAFVSADHTATRFYLTTSDDPYATVAFDAVRHVQQVMRDAAPRFGSGAVAHVGGPTAELADVQTTLASDFSRVGVITVLGVLLVLMLLLRSIIAPLYLVLTVLLSCASAIGLSSWLFQSVLGQPGVSSYLPLMVFVLLVALGSDYNIFLMSRVREESQGRPIHDGVRVASGRTGAVITSAGLILAGTFGSMASAPLVVLFQVGIAVALGVLIDALVVRSILVPAITSLIGDRAWWPSRPWRAGGTTPRLGDLLPVPASALLTAAPVGSPFAPSAVGGPRGRGRIAWRVALLLTVIAIPALFAGLFAWSTADPGRHLDGVTAAIVNEDRGATITGTSGPDQPLQMGADLTARLTATSDPGSFRWLATDAADARAGLESGRYGAVLTVPSGFSAAVAAIAGNQSGAAPRAVLHLATNDGADYYLSALARSVSEAIAASTARTATADALDRILVGVSDAHDRLAGGATGARSIAGDADTLAADAASVSATARGMVSGLRELADGTASATDGVDALATGARDLADGLDTLSSGARSLAGGTHDAAAGAGDLSDGAARLAHGLGQLASATGQLPRQALALKVGADGVAGGAASVASGSRSLADGLATLHAGTTGLGAEARTLDDGAAELLAGLEALAYGAGKGAAGTAALADKAHTLATSVSQYAGGVEALSQNCAALGGSPPLCAQLGGLAAQGPGLSGGAAALADATDLLAGSSGKIAAGAGRLTAGAGELHAGTHLLAAQAPGLEKAIAGAASGANSLASGAKTLAAGARALAAGTAKLAAGMPALAAAAKQSAAGGRSVAGGASALASGLDTLAAGADKVRSGARSAAAGARTLANGGADAADGTTQLIDGLDAALDGARVTQTGADGLATDASALQDSATGLAAGLDDDAVAVPAYAASTRSAVAGVVARPVELATSQLNAIPTRGDGLAPFFMAVALWVGALAAFLAIPPLFWAARWRRWWTGPLAGFAVGAAVGVAQALLMAAVMLLLLGLQAARLPALLLFAALTGVTFAALNQALVAALGNRGRFVAIVLVAVQIAAAGAFAPIETAPAFLQALHPLLPFTYAVEALRALIAGGGASVAMASLVLCGWLAVAVAVTFLVARLRHGALGEPPPAEPDVAQGTRAAEPPLVPPGSPPSAPQPA